MNKRIVAGLAGLAIAGIGLTACGTAPAPKPTATVTITAKPKPAPTVTRTRTVGPSAAPTKTPAPVESTPAASAHEGEVYCTYSRMDTDVCTNGGYVMVSNSAYEQAIAEYGNAYSLSGWFPLSQVQG
jgi:hypothetical protein